MSTSCDDILLDTDYSADAVGGPEWATAVIASGDGGAVKHRNENLEDYVSKYEIEFGNLSESKKRNIRNFTILRRGQARAFLFLAPDECRIDGEHVGFLNPATGEVGYLGYTDGAMTDFYAIKNISDPFTAYNRRLCKLSPYDPVTVTFYHADAPTVPLAEVETDTDVYTRIYYDAIAVSKSQNITVAGVVRNVTIYYREGRISITPALPANIVIRVSAFYFLPVTFNEDWMKFSIDESAVGGFKIGVTEVLPVELGIL